MKIHVIMHESFESPGAIENWAEKNSFQLTYSRLYNGEMLPSEVDFDFLIIMGGPQSPDTSLSEYAHFNAKNEIQFIKRSIDQGKFLLGICLGAQLIGQALGARFDHSPNREIGVFQLTLNEDGINDPIFKTFPTQFMVGHWHADMPGLTSESKVLAVSDGCPRQIVRYSPRVYGFQCHFEFTQESIEEMIKNSSDELAKYASLPYVENAQQLRAHDYTTMNALLFQFLDYIKINAIS